VPEGAGVTPEGGVAPDERPEVDDPWAGFALDDSVFRSFGRWDGR
jgi:hypothetical protein